MSAVELFHNDGKPAGIWYCSECRVVNTNKEHAEWCHGEHLCKCGTQTATRYDDQCMTCKANGWREKEDAAELARFEKATKIEMADYKGSQMFCNDQYFESIEQYRELIEDFDTGESVLPKYVWAVTNVGVGCADIDNLIEPLLAEMGEDAETSDLNGVEELEKAIDTFNEANKSIVVYMVDYSRAILVPENVQAMRKELAVLD